MILKSFTYGSTDDDHPLPYRIDLLRSEGRRLAWTDGHLAGPWQRLAARTEAATTPWTQALLTWRDRRGAAAVIAMFESEGHGLALARRFTRRRRPPLVIIACWLTDLVATGGRRARLYRWLYRSVDAVIVFSSNQVPTLVEALGIDVDRVHVVPFGIDLDELLERSAGDDGRVVAAGRDLGRDWPTLVAAVAGSGWSVDLITRPSQVDGLDLPNEIAFHATLDRTAYLDHLARASVVVLPSHVRDYPTGQTVLLEAMALGKACVVTDTPAMREYVDDGVTGLLVPPHDAAALRAAVERLLADLELRHRIGGEAQRSTIAAGGARTMWAAVGRIVDQVVADAT